MITRIEAYGYRCFRALSVDLSEYQVFAGANGAGKTTLLDIPLLFQDLLRGRSVNDVFLRLSPGRSAPRAHTFTELLHQQQGAGFSFAVEALLPEDIAVRMAERSDASRRGRTPTHLRYEVAFEIERSGIRVDEEYLFLFAADGNRPDNALPLQGRPADRSKLVMRFPDWQPIIIREHGSGLSSYLSETTTRKRSLFPDLRTPREQLALGTAAITDEELFPATRWFARLLADEIVWYEPDWGLLRRAAPPGSPNTVTSDAGNTPWLAKYLQDRMPDQFEAWIDHVRTALPQVESITALEREEDHYAYFRVRYRGGYEVTSSGLSDGTLRILALTLLPYLDPTMLPRLLVIEEPENGIHPLAIEAVIESLQTLVGTQVWVSTHSPIVLAHNKLADLRIARLDRTGEVSVIAGGDHPQLKEWKSSPDIGTLYAAGVLS